MILFLDILVIIFLIAFIGFLVYSMATGAPYAPIGEQKIAAMMELLQVKKGEKAVDLGAGDGRIVIALAKHGAEAHGYEINPLLVMIGKNNIRKSGLSGKAYMHWGDIWRLDLAKFSIVTVYLTAHIMPTLEKKFAKELQPGTRLVMNYFKIPNWKPDKKLDTVYLYKVGNVKK